MPEYLHLSFRERYSLVAATVHICMIEHNHSTLSLRCSVDRS